MALWLTRRRTCQGDGAWAPKTKSSRRGTGARPPCAPQQVQAATTAAAATHAVDEDVPGGCSGHEPEHKVEEAEGHSNEGELEGHSGLTAFSRGSDCEPKPMVVDVTAQEDVTAQVGCD